MPTKAAVKKAAAMPRKAAEAAAARADEVTGLFDQAFRALGDSFKVAMKAQEDTVKFWSEMVGKVNPMHNVAGDLVPTAQKNADAYLRLLESSYRRNAELMKQVMHSRGSGNGSGVEKQTRHWLDASIEVARDNAQDLANTNLRVAQAWTEAFKKGTQQSARGAQKMAAGK